MTRAKAAKLSETSSTPRSPSASIARTTRNSINPFGVSRSRRIDESDIAARPYEGTKCRKPRMRPSPSRASKTTPPAPRSVRSESIDIEKPRSHAPASQRLVTASSSQSVALVELGQLSQLRGVAALLEAGDRLAHLPNRATLEREAPGLDNGLVTDVEGAQPRPDARAERGPR